MTEWLRGAAYKLPIAAQRGPSIHAHSATVPPNLRHIGYFHNHVRVDHLRFDGVLAPTGGARRPADDPPGIGLSLNEADAEPCRAA